MSLSLFTSCETIKPVAGEIESPVVVEQVRIVDADGDGVYSDRDCNDQNASISQTTKYYSANDINADLVGKTKTNSIALSDYRQLKISEICGVNVPANTTKVGSIAAQKTAVYYYYENATKSLEAKTFAALDGANAYSLLNATSSSYKLAPSALNAISEESEVMAEVHASPNGSYVVFDRSIPRTVTTLGTDGIEYRNYTLGTIDALYTSGPSFLKKIPASAKKDLNNFGDLVVEQKIYNVSDKVFKNLGAHSNAQVHSIDLSTQIALIEEAGQFKIINYVSGAVLVELGHIAGSTFFLRKNKIFALTEANELTVFEAKADYSAVTEILAVNLDSETSITEQSISADGKYLVYANDKINVINLDLKIMTFFESEVEVKSAHVGSDGKTVFAYAVANNSANNSDVVLWKNPMLLVNQ